MPRKNHQTVPVAAERVLPQVSVKRPGLKRKTREALAAYVLLAPGFLGLVVFVILPMIYAFWVSLHKWDALSIQFPFVGLKNYEASFRDIDWLQSLGRTFLYTFMFVPALYIMSLILALIVKSVSRFSGVLRTVFFLPVVMSPVITGVIWKIMYDDKAGILNRFLTMIGLHPVHWITSTKVSLISVVITSVWLGMGYYMIIFLAGLQDIPKDYYEAAKIDGANSWQSFWHITFPNLRHTSIFVAVVSIIGSFQVFDLIMLMTNGDPANSTLLVVQDIYEKSFVQYHFGYASALAFILFIVILVFTLIQMKLLKIYEE